MSVIPCVLQQTMWFVHIKLIWQVPYVTSSQSDNTSWVCVVSINSVRHIIDCSWHVCLDNPRDSSALVSLGKWPAMSLIDEIFPMCFRDFSCILNYCHNVEVTAQDMLVSNFKRLEPLYILNILVDVDLPSYPYQKRCKRKRNIADCKLNRLY